MDAPPETAAAMAAREPAAAPPAGVLGDSQKRRTNPFRDAPAATGKPSVRNAARCRRSARLPSGLLPKPRPGRSRWRPARPRVDGAARGLREERGDVAERVVVAHVVLHRARVRALHVHEDSAGSRRGDRSGEVRVEAPGRDVVDEVGAGGEGLARDGGLARVDRDRRVDPFADAGDDRDDAVDLLRDGDLRASP